MALLEILFKVPFPIENAKESGQYPGMVLVDLEGALQDMEVNNVVKGRKDLKKKGKAPFC